jgi:predicted dehydrogenase
MIFDDGHHTFALARHLDGPISRVHTTARQTTAGPGLYADIPAMVTWEHTSGTLGCWVASFSPGLYIHTRQYPAQDSIEVTGANGILWVTRGHGHLTSLPPVIVAKGQSIDYHNDMAADWAISFQRASQHFLTSIETSMPAVLSASDAREIMRVALAAGRSAQTGHPADVAAL